MAKLPYSRVVNVTLSRNDAFPSRRGFGVPLFVTTQTIPGILDADHRTKVYGEMQEVAADFNPGDAFYNAAETAFSQNPKPLQLKAGFIDGSTSPFTKTVLKGELDKIYDKDQDWYWLCADKIFRDTDELDGAIEWIGTKNKQLALDTNDERHKDPTDESCISARHKGTVDRVFTFYHNNPDEYCAFALAASLGTRNFDDANSAYTAKFKRLRGIPPLNEGSAAIQSITGFVPQLGQSESIGHMANTYVDIGGQDFVVEGSTLTPNVFIDEIHATDWIIARTEEEMLAILLNNDRIPFTDQGMEQIASAARMVMQQADRAKLVASDINPESGERESSVKITVPSVFDVPASQRKARVAPAISVQFRYAGAIHYTTVHYTMNF